MKLEQKKRTTVRGW